MLNHRFGSHHFRPANFPHARRRGPGCRSVGASPASAWDLQGDADPSTWRYRCDFIGPSGSMTETLPADGVLHFRINADSRTPWRGRSSLSLAVLSGELAARVERALFSEMKLPIGRIATNTGTPEQSVKYGDSLVEGGFTVTALGQSQVAQEPGGRWTPAKYGPEPHTVIEALRSNLGRDLAAAFGVPSSLFEPRGDGAGQRESWRRFWIGTIAPLGKSIQAELRLKLENSADVSFEALRASDEDGRSRAISRRRRRQRPYPKWGSTEARRCAWRAWLKRANESHGREEKFGTYIFGLIFGNYVSK